jgi:hypothetical protein
MEILNNNVSHSRENGAKNKVFHDGSKAEKSPDGNRNLSAAKNTALAKLMIK